MSAKKNSPIKLRTFGYTPEGDEVLAYLLTNIHGLSMEVISYGCTITSLHIPDREGNPGDIVLGYDHLEGYLQSDHYIGCVIGRYANRIAYGQLPLNGKTYNLTLNHSPHHLHGGVLGFGRKLWKAREVHTGTGTGILFSYFSPSGDEGYPGNLHVEVQYVLSHNNALICTYRARTDEDTILNMTQHSYFNLGAEESILNHELKINSSEIVLVDNTLIPTGEKKSVDGSAFDFRKFKSIGLEIENNDQQLLIAHGYDHNWVLHHESHTSVHAATLCDPASGRKMEVWTTEPGLHIYTANFLESGLPGKRNISFGPRSGICLETQHFPDTPHHPAFPSVVITPEKGYASETVYAFGVR